MLGPQVEDPLLELVLLRLEVEGRRDQRRPLLARVSDPRALGRQLRGDQEPEDEERDAERDLPGRDGADARRERRHATRSAGGGAPPRRSATTETTIKAPIPRTAPWLDPELDAGATTAGTGVAEGVGPAASGVAAPALGDGRRHDDRPGRRRGTRPARRQRPCGCRLRAVLPWASWPRGPRASPPGTPRGPGPSACVNASSSVSPAEYALTRLTSASWPACARGSRSPTPTPRTRGCVRS